MIFVLFKDFFQFFPRTFCASAIANILLLFLEILREKSVHCRPKLIHLYMPEILRLGSVSAPCMW